MKRRGTTYDVVGPVCETGDTFAVGREMPECRAGDLLAIRCTGAYGASMSSTYNSRPLAAEVLVDEGRYAVIRRRQSFEEMIAGIQTDIAKLMYRVQIVSQEEQQLQDRLQNAKASHGDEVDAAEAKKKPVVNGETIGRNDPCPCGSGKKYKNCCGRNK